MITLFADACTGQSFLPDLYAGLRDAGCEVKINSLENIFVLGKPSLIGNAVGILLTLAGFTAVGFIIWGGIQYSMSAGDPGKVKKAKDTIINAIVGLVLALLSFGIVKFITGGF